MRWPPGASQTVRPSARLYQPVRLLASMRGIAGIDRYVAVYSLANSNDLEIEDELARAQKRLRDLKSRISAQSKKNFVLERDVRYLDSRIALLIQNVSGHTLDCIYHSLQLRLCLADGSGREGRGQRIDGRDRCATWRRSGRPPDAGAAALL